MSNYSLSITGSLERTLKLQSTPKAVTNFKEPEEIKEAAQPLQALYLSVLNQIRGSTWIV
jgi:hypothetical protein